VSRTGLLPPGFALGAYQGAGIIGETTEAIHRFLLDGWSGDRPPPRIEEDLSFVPRDREEVLYVYMYRAAENPALRNSKQFRAARITQLASETEREASATILYERAPVYVQLYYLLAAHAKFRSDAERLMGWALLRLHDATHLVYRPRRFALPDGRVVDSRGRAWSDDADGDDVIMEKVSLNLVDDLTLGDAVQFFTIHEAPFRPFLTYRAMCALEGPLVAGPPTTVRTARAEPVASAPVPARSRPTGGRLDTRSARKAGVGPTPYRVRSGDTDSHEE
jgi:hypothetical protein